MSNLLLAIGWTVVLIADVISATAGNNPNWILVLCPLTILVLDRWMHCFDE